MRSNQYWWGLPVSPANEYFVSVFVLDQVGGLLSVCNKRAGERARSLMAAPLLWAASPVHHTPYSTPYTSMWFTPVSPHYQGIVDFNTVNTLSLLQSTTVYLPNRGVFPDTSLGMDLWWENGCTLSRVGMYWVSEIWGKSWGQRGCKLYKL